ncbi:hypothetical protein HYU94_00160 [Candidatus Daviesbacteria bacterium]|nr:hypothetical protein [Candidatus Daviesbacteria bacterium]
MDLWTIITILIFASFLWPLLKNRLDFLKRLALIKKIEEKRKSRVITMIHRQETLSILGIPLTRYITIEDSEQILRAIRLTPDTLPIDLILHTPGGLLLASEQIANALKRRQGKVTVIIPFYAMSGGTLISIAADEILMAKDAVLGSLDPIISSAGGNFYPAVSIVQALTVANKNRSDQTLILGDVAKKAISQIKEIVYSLLLEHQDKNQALQITKFLASGERTHDFPLTFEQIKQLKLPVSDAIPEEINQLMALYPQPALKQQSVEFIPTPYQPIPKKNR